MKKKVGIGDIRIPEVYQAHGPRREKVEAKKAMFLADHRFDMLPVLDQDLVLIDGYACYMAARELGHETLYCRVEDHPTATVVTARHHDNGKEYEWELPRRCCTPGYISVGTDIAVMTRFGRKKVTVTGMRQVPALEAKNLRTALGRWHKGEDSGEGKVNKNGKG